MNKLLTVIMTCMLLVGVSSTSYAQQVKYDDMLNVTTYQAYISEFRVFFFGTGKNPSCVDSANVEFSDPIVDGNDYREKQVPSAGLLVKVDSTVMTLEGTGKPTHNLVGRYMKFTFPLSTEQTATLMSASEVVLRFTDEVPTKKTFKQTYKTTLLEKWSKLIPACGS